MRPLKNFKEFVKQGTVNKRTPNIARAKSLCEEAEKRKKFLDELFRKIELEDKNANRFIENSYDILIELIRARMLREGYYASGEGAHEAEVSFMQEIGFPEKDVRFMNDLRYFRNGILYYGKSFDVEYAKGVLNFLKKIYPKIKP